MLTLDTEDRTFMASVDKVKLYKSTAPNEEASDKQKQ